MPTLYPTTDAEVYINVATDETFLDSTSDPPTFPQTYQMVSGSGFSGLGMKIQVKKDDGWGGADYAYQVRRYIVEFNTSGIINRTPASAHLSLYGSAASNDANVICVETTLQSTGSIVGDDFVGHNETNPVAYTDTVSGSSIGAGYTGNIWSFTDAGLSAMGSLDKLQMTCMEKTYDYDRTEPPNPIDIETEFLQDTDDNSYDLYQPFLTYTMRTSDKISSGKVIISSGKVTIK